MPPGDNQETPIGVVLMENLTKALINNTNSQIASALEFRELREEMKLLREDIEGLGGVSGEMLGHLTTYLRILDHVSMSSVERAPKWKDVQAVLLEIKDEIQQQEAEQEAEEKAEEEASEREGGKGRSGSEIFPRKTS
jgi:hypothetical protein